MHRGAGLGQEVLDDHLLHVAVAAMRRGDRLERGDAVGAGLADADEDAGGERDRELAGGLERGQAPLGRLVGRAAVAVEVVAERLDHHPLAGRDGSQRGELVGVERAGVGVGQQAGLVEHELRHRGEVVDRRVVAVRRRATRRATG